jgi:general stress protein YciG
MADSNPGNFANRPKEEVREIASKGGKASRSTGSAQTDDDDHDQAGRTSTGQFKPGSEEAKEAGRKGGQARQSQT